MAYISYDKLWRSDFNNNTSAKDSVRDINPHQVKLKVTDTFEKDEEIGTKIDNDPDVVYRANLDAKLSYLEDHSSYIEKAYNEFKMLKSKQPVEEILKEKTVETTIQIPVGKVSFNKFDKADEVKKSFFLVERLRFDLDQKPTQYSKMTFKDFIQIYSWKFKATSNIKYKNSTDLQRCRYIFKI